MKCVICQGELVVLRATTELEENGWLCRCQGSCKVLQTISDEELEESYDKGSPNEEKTNH